MHKRPDARSRPCRFEYNRLLDRGSDESGPSDEATDKYFTANEIIPRFERGHKDEETKVTTGDYLLDEKNHSSVLTEAGVTKAEKSKLI